MIKRTIFLLTLLFFALCSPYAQDSVNIGLLIQDKNQIAAVRGAELAVNIANQQGGLKGKPFQLITKSMEGPWGTGSKQAVSLIWDYQVCALVGSHDGRNAHLVEQASAKSIVPFISAWSSDPTLSQAFIPWFFNLISNDEQQADALLHEMFKEKKFRKVVVISDNSYDSNQAMKSFLKRSENLSYAKPVFMNFSTFSHSPEVFIAALSSHQADCIVLLANPKFSYQVVNQLTINKMDLPVYGFFFILNENSLSEKEFFTLKRRVIIPDAGWSESKLSDFRKLYIRRYGKTPGPVAIFSFDATNALINAIRTAGIPDNDKIRSSLATLNYEGITGRIHFGNLGVRLNSCEFKKL